MTIKESLGKAKRADLLERLGDLYDKAPVMLHSIDGSGRLLSVNARWLEVLGYDREEVLGRPLVDFFTEESRRKTLAFLPRFFQEGRVKCRPCRLVAKDGRILDVLLSAVGECDDAGNFVRSLAVVEDVTNRRRAEQALEASEELFRLAFESANEGLCIMDPDGAFLLVNEALCRFFGYSESRLLDMTVDDLTFPEEEGASLRHVTAAVAKGQDQFRCERRYRHASGRAIWARVSARLLRDARAAPRFFISHVQDITEARRNAEQLRLHAQTLEALLRLSRMPDAGLADIGRFVLSRAVALTGSEIGFVALLEEDGKSFRLLASDSSTEGAEACDVPGVPEPFSIAGGGAWTQAYWTGRPHVVNDYETPHVGKKGLPPGHRPLRRFLVTPALDNGLARLLVAVANKPEDYDEADSHRLSLLGEGILGHIKNRRREQDLERARSEAEAASQAKSGFLANMSHEIRTPLSGIIGLTQMTLGQNPRPQIRENLELILDSSRSLLAIVNDILDFSKIEAGKMEFTPVDFDLREALDRTMKPFQFSFRQKGLKLSVRISPDVPDVLHGDPDRLMQVIRNLVGNALKFTERGEVTIEVRLLRADDPLLVECSVRDTGIGIPEDRLPELFQVFSQLEASRAKRFGGTGLGLAISKRLVEMMGGTIQVESRLGQGSLFAFTVALRPAQEAAADAYLQPTASQPTGFAGLRVLLAEDNQVNRLFLRHFLLEAGCEVQCAGSGGEVLDLLVGATFDLVLMDIQMPEMDGMEATRRIREGAAGEAVRSLPVVALTAYSMKGDRERFLSAGLDDYVSKPVDVGELFMVMRRVLERPGGASRVASGRQGPPMDMAYYDDRGKTAFAREICRMFLDESPSVVASLDQAVEKGDWSAAGEAAHTLLGMAVPLRARSLTEGARRLQMACLGGDAAGSMEACQLVRDELDRVQKAIRDLLE